MSRLDKYRVLIIDDIGYVKKTDGETQVLFEFIAHRYESGSLIITSNQPFSQWDQIFLLPANILSGFVANKLSGLCLPKRREHESDKMATGDTTNAIRRGL